MLRAFEKTKKELKHTNIIVEYKKKNYFSTRSKSLLNIRYTLTQVPLSPRRKTPVKQRITFRDAFSIFYIINKITRFTKEYFQETKTKILGCNKLKEFLEMKKHNT